VGIPANVTADGVPVGGPPAAAVCAIRPGVQNATAARWAATLTTCGTGTAATASRGDAPQYPPIASPRAIDMPKAIGLTAGPPTQVTSAQVTQYNGASFCDVRGYPADHNLALAAKAIIRAYYKTTPTRSYFDGCSDGGREALVEEERYPATTLTSITVSPLNPAAPVTVSGSGPACDASYHWAGQLLHGNERWCDVNGMEFSCRTRSGGGGHG
jgi:hypothetical protein